MCGCASKCRPRRGRSTEAVASGTSTKRIALTRNDMPPIDEITLLGCQRYVAANGPEFKRTQFQMRSRRCAYGEGVGGLCGAKRRRCGNNIGREVRNFDVARVTRRVKDEYCDGVVRYQHRNNLHSANLGRISCQTLYSQHQGTAYRPQHPLAFLISPSSSPCRLPCLYQLIYPPRTPRPCRPLSPKHPPCATSIKLPPASLSV